VRLDIAGRQAWGIQGEDLVVEPLKAPLALLDDLRGEAAIAIARGLDRELAMLGDNRFGVDPFRVFAAPPGGSWWRS
jgi:hypothetical protein